MNNNVHLQSARNMKYDEFYTPYEIIEEELLHYAHHFKNKVVYCNCDDPLKSNFCAYFIRNFNYLGIYRLIVTSYQKEGKGLIFDVTDIPHKIAKFYEGLEEVFHWIQIFH